MRQTRAFLQAKSSISASTWLVDRIACVGKYCRDNEYYIQALQGKQLIPDATKRHLIKLQQELMWIVSINTSGVELQDIPGVFWLACFQVRIDSVESFLLTLGSTYVIELINTYKARNEAHYTMLLDRLANLFLHLVYRINILEPQRNENNTARVGPCLAAMPFWLAEAGAFMFSFLCGSKIYIL